MKKLIICIAAILISTVFVQAQRTEGMLSANVSGRNIVGNIPRPVYNVQESGIVVVDIWVDNYGNVARAVPGGDGTTVLDKTLHAAARKSAMETHFNMSADAPAMQQGTITYYFGHSGSPEANNGVFTFLDIPIDGTKSKMVSALKAKGFQIKSLSTEQMTGVFNGENVTLDISTNHGIVDKVIVVYPYCSNVNDTRIKYNTLLSRFNRTGKYVCVNPRKEVPADENIALKLFENSKYYDAIYFYLNSGVNSVQWVSEFKQEYQKYYNKQLGDISYEEMEEVLFCLPLSVSAAVSGVVWFTMVDTNYININYINFKNRPRGEDL